MESQRSASFCGSTSRTISAWTRLGSAPTTLPHGRSRGSEALTRRGRATASSVGLAACAHRYVPFPVTHAQGGDRSVSHAEYAPFLPDASGLLRRDAVPPI